MADPKAHNPDDTVIAQLRRLVPVARREGLHAAAGFLQSFLDRNIKPNAR